MTMQLHEMEALLSEAGTRGLSAFKVFVLRNIMVDPISTYLRYNLYTLGKNASVEFGEYDNILQEAIGAEKKIAGYNPNVIAVFLHLETISWQLSRCFNELSAAQVEEEIQRIHEYAAATIRGVRAQSNGMILWVGFAYQAFSSLGIFEHQINTGQNGSIARLNQLIKDELSGYDNAYFLDINALIYRLGSESFFDARMWHAVKNPYSTEALEALAGEIKKFLGPLLGKNKKCIVLDCDNTLWGGIIGEDGMSGIKLGKTHPGSAFYEFQQEVINLYNRGIIVALCSKNNEHDVLEVIRNHPDMLLKEKHLATWQINWQDKATNLRQIALDLNIGLDSIVFFDDSYFEANLIRDMIPEIEVIEMPKENPERYRDILASCGLFDSLTVSAEDKKRGTMYKAEASRKKLRAEVTDLDTYLKSLEMVVHVKFGDEFSLPRLAQLTQRVNQFNLTTRRYSEQDVSTYMAEKESDVLYMRLEDKFGDSGIVGLIILKYQGETAEVDTLLLSCRVLGRGAEDVFMIEMLRLAKKNGAKKVVGKYIKTMKNAQTETFFTKHGFEEVDASGDEADRLFIYDIESGINPHPAFFKEIASTIL